MRSVCENGHLFIIHLLIYTCCVNSPFDPHNTKNYITLLYISLTKELQPEEHKKKLI